MTRWSNIKGVLTTDFKDSRVRRASRNDKIVSIAPFLIEFFEMFFKSCGLALHVVIPARQKTPPGLIGSKYTILWPDHLEDFKVG
jgi:hypothetical protein